MEGPEERGPCALFTKPWSCQEPTLRFSERTAGRADGMACLGLEAHDTCRGNIISGSAACCSTLRGGCHPVAEDICFYWLHDALSLGLMEISMRALEQKLKLELISCS